MISAIGHYRGQPRAEIAVRFITTANLYDIRGAQTYGFAKIPDEDQCVPPGTAHRFRSKGLRGIAQTDYISARDNKDVPTNPA